MTKKATNKETGNAHRTRKWFNNKRPVIRPVIETIWWLWLAVDANLITGSKAA